MQQFEIKTMNQKAQDDRNEVHRSLEFELRREEMLRKDLLESRRVDGEEMARNQQFEIRKAELAVEEQRQRVRGLELEGALRGMGGGSGGGGY